MDWRWRCVDRRMVQQGMGLARGDIVEIDSDDEPEVVPPSLQEMIDMCWKMEECFTVVCEKGTLDFVMAVCRYRGHTRGKSPRGQNR